MATVFERIISGELPATVLFEDDSVIAIRDIHPVAPVHVLIISKKVIASLQAVEAADLPIVQRMVEVAQQLAIELGVDEGYRLITNIGSPSGQTIFHLHFHLLGGRPLGLLG